MPRHHSTGGDEPDENEYSGFEEQTAELEPREPPRREDRRAQTEPVIKPAVAAPGGDSSEDDENDYSGFEHLTPIAGHGPPGPFRRASPGEAPCAAADDSGSEADGTEHSFEDQTAENLEPPAPPRREDPGPQQEPPDEEICAGGHQYDYVEDCEAEGDTDANGDDLASDLAADDDLENGRAHAVAHDGRDYDYAEDCADDLSSNPSVDVSYDDDNSIESVHD